MQALKFITETQTEKREVISLCHLSEKVIALEISEVARKLFKLNRNLFNKINNSTKIIDGRIIREEITMRHYKSPCQLYQIVNFLFYELSSLFLFLVGLLSQVD